MTGKLLAITGESDRVEFQSELGLATGAVPGGGSVNRSARRPRPRPRPRPRQVPGSAAAPRRAGGSV